MDQCELIKEVLHNPENSTRNIPTKNHSYALYHAGYFGNRPKTWKTRQEIRQSGWKENVCIRDVRGTRRGGKNKHLPLYNIPLEALDAKIERLKSLGVPESAMTFNQSMPDEHLTIQGEVRKMTNGCLYITYSDVQEPMNKALQQKELLAQGLEAKLLLQQHLWPASMEEVNHSLYEFSTNPNSPSAVVEFSAYSIGVGDLPGRNAVIWEVRNF